MINYNPTNWIDYGGPPINANNLNNIELGIVSLQAVINTISITTSANSIVERDQNGNINANIFNGTLNGNASTATNASELQGMTATNANTASTIVQRDTNGNFSAGTITASLNGTASNATDLQNMAPSTSATADTIVQRDGSGNITANTFNGTLNGTASNATDLQNMVPSTSATANTIVQRDGSGNITANTFNGSLNGNASTATELASAITLTLSGDVSGSATLQGNGQTVTLSTTLNSSAVSATILHLDDAQYSTTSTTATLEKTFRFIQSTDNPVSSLNVYASAWNDSSGATTTVSVNIDGGTNSTATTTSTTETVLTIANLNVPSTAGIHTFYLYIQTSNASYSAYTQILEVYAS